jgi:hypothetical protein
MVYEMVMPAAQHRALRKVARQTNPIERFNNTMCQRLSPLVRDALSFRSSVAERYHSFTRAVSV